MAKESENPPEYQMAIHASALIAVVTGAIILFALLPVLLFGFLIGAIWYGAYLSDSEHTYNHLILAVALVIITYVFVLGLIPISNGILFDHFNEWTGHMVTRFLFTLNHALPKKVKIASSSIGAVRIYLWLSIAFAVAWSTLFHFRRLRWPERIYYFVTKLAAPFGNSFDSRLAFIKLWIPLFAVSLLFYSQRLISDLVGLIFILSSAAKLIAMLLDLIGFDFLFVKREGFDGPISIGVELTRRAKKATLTEAQLNHHVHVVGASGFGKSVLLSHIIEHRIKSGSGLLFVDLKADFETIKQVVSNAKAADRLDDLHIFSCGNPEISSPYNVVSRGTANQIRDRIVTALNWSEEFYKNEASSVLLKLLIGLVYLRDKRNRPFDLHVILNALTYPTVIEEIANAIPESELWIKEQLEELARSLKNAENLKSLQGLRSQLQSLTYSDFGKLLAASDKGIDLFTALREQKIIYILLDSRSYGESAKSLGKLILQDLKAASAKIDNELSRSERMPFTVVVDEFADMATEDFIAFLDRARSSKIGVVVAHQEIADLDRISPEFKKRLMNSTSTLYAFLQKLPDSSELIAGIAGTRKTLEVTEQAESKFLLGDIRTGMKSIKEVDEFQIHPNTVRSLGVGECVCIEKYPYSRSSVLRVNFETARELSDENLNDALRLLTKRSDLKNSSAPRPRAPKIRNKITSDRRLDQDLW